MALVTVFACRSQLCSPSIDIDVFVQKRELERCISSLHCNRVGCGHGWITEWVDLLGTGRGAQGVRGPQNQGLCTKKIELMESHRAHLKVGMS